MLIHAYRLIASIIRIIDQDKRYLLEVVLYKFIFINMETKTCPSCSKLIDVSAKFCPECGQALVKQITESAVSPKPPGSARNEFLMVAGVVVAISIGYFVFSSSQPVPQPTSQMPAGHEDVGPMGAGMPNLPEDYDGLVTAGDEYMNQNNFPIAAECYKRALALDGSSPDVRSDFASCLYGMGLAERALEEFRSIKKNSPLHGVTLFNLGVVFMGQNMPDSAKFYLTEYLELEPNGKAAQQARDYLKELGI